MRVIAVVLALIILCLTGCSSQASNAGESIPIEDYIFFIATDPARQHYHYKSCIALQGMNTASIKLKEAIDLGVTSCPECKPLIIEEGEDGQYVAYDPSRIVVLESPQQDIQTIRLRGTGDDVKTATLPQDWYYLCRFKTESDSNVIVYCNGDLAINEIGAFEGEFLCPEYEKDSEIEFEITTGAAWTLQIVPLDYTQSINFIDKGMKVSGLFSCAGDMKFDISHSGSSNFIVYCITGNGSDLIVNEIGDYSGTKKVSMPNSGNGIWVVKADGKWSIKEVE